jgi:hypothetical protein
VVLTTFPAVEEARADLLSNIAQCESGGNQFDANGRVLRNKYNPSVVGVFQLNEHYHAAAARKMGFDIYTSKGNWGYAQWLLQNFGTTPWLSSRQCWSRVAAK